MACAAAVLLAGCAAAPRWSTPRQPSHADARTLLRSADPSVVFGTASPTAIPEVPPPTHFRPCCAFGSDLRVRVGFLRIPGIDLLNVIGPERLGHHRYDNGLVQTKATVGQARHARTERNGLVYTCRGGFIDVAHVRNWIDWSTYLATRIARDLDTGTTLELPAKGGTRIVRIAAMDAATIARTGRLAAAVPVAQWTAYQLSVWDEISTWYGWSHLPVFSERASAFSPEDLYSNLVGLKIMAALVATDAVRTEALFDDSVDRWLKEILVQLGAVEQSLGREAARSVEGLWWDSRRAIPQMELVRRRHVADALPLAPWRVPRARMSPALRAACDGAGGPVPLAIPERDEEGVPLGTRVRIEIRADPAILAQEPFRTLRRPLSQDDFPAILASIEADARHRFGPSATRPD